MLLPGMSRRTSIEAGNKDDQGIDQKHHNANHHELFEYVPNCIGVQHCGDS